MERDTRGIHAFVAEHGDERLALEAVGVPTFFVVTVLLVPDDGVAAQRARAEAVRGRFFGAGEMKSSVVGADISRRKQILEALATLELESYSLAVDRRELEREGGLAHRPALFKYLNRRLYDRIYKLFDQVKLVGGVGGVGDEEGFLTGFFAHVEERLPLTLFSRPDVSRARSADEIMLQVADMISGSLDRALDPRRPGEGEELLALLHRRAVGIEVWPPRALPAPEPRPDGVPDPAGADDTARDDFIRRHCLRQAQLYLKTTGRFAAPADWPEELRAAVEILQILLFQVQFADATKYVPTGRLLDKLQAQAGLLLTKRKLRSTIAGLRDAGVVIARSAKGYKIPIGESDVAEFVAHANTIVPPMLERVRHARRDLARASDGALDILASPRFDLLRRLVAVVEAGPVDEGQSSSPPPPKRPGKDKAPRRR